MDIRPTALFYLLSGLAFLGLTLRPAFNNKFFYNVPALYIAVGAFAGTIGLPHISPLGGGIETKIIAHAAELIVIISLAGTGLAIDVKASWKNWLPTWRLLLFAMPLTIAAIAWLGVAFAGLTLASALLLGACLAPTDPVLARAVSVGPPGTNEHGTRGALTAEAGLNDGLAFPFVWLAIGVATAATLSDFSWTEWLAIDGLYRIAGGMLIGLGSGWLITKLLFSPIGDASNERANQALVVLAATFLAYGLAEMIGAYGFISVFVAARAAREFSENTQAEPYEIKAHEAADQLESILMALLLLWLGTFIAQELWHVWTITDFLIATSIILIVRPALGLLSLLGSGLGMVNNVKLGFFGIRGMGTIFYLAFAQTHADFADIESVWRITGLTILISVVLHGSLANVWMSKDEKDKDVTASKGNEVHEI